MCLHHVVNALCLHTHITFYILFKTDNFLALNCCSDVNTDLKYNSWSEMTPSTYRLVLHKPRFYYAIQPAKMKAALQQTQEACLPFHHQNRNMTL